MVRYQADWKSVDAAPSNMNIEMNLQPLNDQRFSMEDSPV